MNNVEDLSLMTHILVRAARKEIKQGDVTVLQEGWSGKASLRS